MSDALEMVLRLVAEGRLSPDEAAPLIAALDEGGGIIPPLWAPTSPPDAPADADVPMGALAHSLRVQVNESGRAVVNLRVPLGLSQAAMAYIPGLSADDTARIRDALARGLTGPIFDVADEDGDGVRIVLE